MQVVGIYCHIASRVGGVLNKQKSGRVIKCAVNACQQLNELVCNKSTLC